MSEQLTIKGTDGIAVAKKVIDNKAMDTIRDGYANLVTQLGTSKDKSLGAFFLPDRFLSWAELSSMYEQDAMSARIVDRLVDDATRVEWHLSGTDDTIDWDSIKSELDDLDTMNQVADAWRWGRLYGGGLVVMAINDGRKFSEPIDWPNIKSVAALSVMDSTNVMPLGFIPGIGSRAFAEPQQYEVLIPWAGKHANERIIHRSRVVRINGMRVPASRMVINGGWGPGVLQRVYREIKRLGQTMGYAENLLHEISVMIVKITGFRDMLSGGPGAESSVKQLLENLKWGIDNLHLFALDKDDDFSEVKRSVDGVAALIQEFVSALVRGTNYPRLILTGEQPGGLNADAKGEIRAYYDFVSAEQGIVLVPALNQIMEVVMAARRNRGEAAATEWTIKFASLIQQAPEAKAETLLKMAQSLQILTTMGAVNAAEARVQLEEMGLIGAATDPEGPATVEEETTEVVPEEEEEELDGPGMIPSTDPIPDDLMSPREAAERFGLPTRSITILIDKGALRFWGIGSHRQVSMADIAALAKKHEQEQDLIS